MPNPTRSEIGAYQEAIAALELSASNEVEHAISELDLSTDEGWELAEPSELEPMPNRCK